MTKRVASCYGTTEMAGLCTYTRLDASIELVQATLGYDFPISPMSIRDIMKENGMAGDEKPNNEIGEICFKGPQVI